MKIPGTLRRMDFEIEGFLDNFKEVIDGFSATFTVTAEQFNTSFREVFSLDDTNWKEEVNKASLRVIEKTQEIPLDEEKNSGAIERQARLTPAICSCCGGRIGKNNYCEFCGMRYW